MQKKQLSPLPNLDGDQTEAPTSQLEKKQAPSVWATMLVLALETPLVPIMHGPLTDAELLLKGRARSSRTDDILKVQEVENITGTTPCPGETPRPSGVGL